MRRERLVLFIVAGVCLAAAVVLRPNVEPELGGTKAVSVEAAVGQSMGGLRVLLIDVLFLRAQSLQAKARADGSLEEAALLYETILELDPSNDVAAAYLVDVYVGDLLPLAETPEDRFTWWERAWNLVRRARDLNPASARIHVRIAQMLLDAFLPADVVPRIEAAVPDRRRRAVAHLRRAAELRANLARLGYLHLRMLGAVALQAAAEGGRDGDTALYQEGVSAAEWLLRRRGTYLARMGYQVVRDQEQGDVLPLDQVVRVGLEAVETIAAARRNGDGPAVREVIRRYRALVGDNLLVQRLEAWADA